jgi:hypothetical protein
MIGSFSAETMQYATKSKNEVRLLAFAAPLLYNECVK